MNYTTYFATILAGEGYAVGVATATAADVIGATTDVVGACCSIKYESNMAAIRRSSVSAPCGWRICIVVPLGFCAVTTINKEQNVLSIMQN